MNEATLKTALVKKLREGLAGAVVIRHEDIRTAGIPDLSVTWRGNTWWVEVKYANPTIHQREQQHLTMTRLAAHGKAVYVVYYAGDKQVRVYRPLNFPSAEPEFIAKGYDHNSVVEFLRRMS